MKNPYDFEATERIAVSDERERRAELSARFCPVELPPERPDAEQSVAHRLRTMAADLIQFKRWQAARASGQGNWRNQIEDTQQIRDLALEAALAIEPVIVRVLAAADVHESKAREL